MDTPAVAPLGHPRQVVLPSQAAMPPHGLRFEEAGGQRLPLGGVNGYLGVRGGQGKKKDKFQGVTPKKRHRTGHFHTAKEAAIKP